MGGGEALRESVLTHVVLASIAFARAAKLWIAAAARWPNKPLPLMPSPSMRVLDHCCTTSS
ncbi:unnamed protein product [Periconia digitata]|uniref:Uncharacterized protein n=1 Tax=Periconia digitata TaxID=1303443 RepID=A0A9W4XSL2_9PLEO|nr:unnamed protein product [Periconia digitata]